MPLSPNMNLPIPVPSQTGGPQYALDEQSCFQQIDSHNHTPGQGSQIPINALNVNQDLSMSGYSIINLKSLQLNNQTISPGSSSLYMLGNDLYFSDGTGAFNVQITSGNAVAVSGAVGFAGLPSGTASAAYQSILGTFRFQSATNTAATLDIGPIKLRNTLASGNAVTLNAPNPLPANYSITFPTSTPATTKIMQMASTGDIYNALDVDNSTIQIVGNNIQVGTLPANSVDSIQLVDGSVGTDKLTSTSLLQNSGNFIATYPYPVPNDANNHLVNVTTNLYTKILSANSGRPILFNMVKDTSNAQDISFYWDLSPAPSSGFQIFGGFGFPGPQIQGWLSVKFNGVEISRLGYRAFSNGNYSAATYQTVCQPFSLILVPSSTGNQTISIDLISYGMIYGNGTLTWRVLAYYNNFQVITF